MNAVTVWIHKRKGTFSVVSSNSGCENLRIFDLNVLLNLSTALLFVFGFIAVKWWTLNSLKTFWTSSSRSSVSRSVHCLFGMRPPVSRRCLNAPATGFEPLFLIGIAQAYFERRSTVVKMHPFPASSASNSCRSIRSTCSCSSTSMTMIRFLGKLRQTTGWRVWTSWPRNHSSTSWWVIVSSLSRTSRQSFS